MRAAVLLFWCLAAGCLPTRQIADETRPLGIAAGDGYSVELIGKLVAWHHPAGCRGDFLCTWEPRHDAAAVGFDVWVHHPPHRFLPAHGTGDHTEWVKAPCPGRRHGPAVAEARAAYAALRAEICPAPDRFAYRVANPLAEQSPWRAAIVLPDRVLYGFADGEPASCESALAALPPAPEWMRNRARSGVCRGLADLDRTDAMRCEMREADPRLLGVASRGVPELQDTSPEVVAAVLDATRADTTHYAPYRVRALVDAVADPSALAMTQVRLQARCATDCLPWERLAWARIAARRADHEACRTAVERADELLAAGAETDAAALLTGVQGCGIDDVLAPSMAALWVLPTTPLTVGETWSCPPERAVGPQMVCGTLPDLATAWAAHSCPRDLVADAERLRADPATSEVTRRRAGTIAGACRPRPSAEATARDRGTGPVSTRNP